MELGRHRKEHKLDLLPCLRFLDWTSIHLSVLHRFLFIGDKSCDPQANIFKDFPSPLPISLAALLRWVYYQPDFQVSREQVVNFVLQKESTELNLAHKGCIDTIDTEMREIDCARSSQVIQFGILLLVNQSPKTSITYSLSYWLYLLLIPRSIYSLSSKCALLKRRITKFSCQIKKRRDGIYCQRAPQDRIQSAIQVE
ncbi:unnamed protein product [Dovyalis caffra]|uniref:Uncharacterized protein n=1 Tax=Dovyalis caffra TaxID=77055 RepID=A0AAV1QXA8_9ROSI|nr:unnamed protein product [Dovyalis caffra]